MTRPTFTTIEGAAAAVGDTAALCTLGGAGGGHTGAFTTLIGHIGAASFTGRASATIEGAAAAIGNRPALCVLFISSCVHADHIALVGVDGATGFTGRAAPTI